MAKKKYDDDVKKYTPAQLRKAKNAAKKYYKDNDGEVSVKVLSRVAKVPQGYIRDWMKEEDWDIGIKEDPGDKVILSNQTKELLTSGAEQFDLSEQEELFCYHYMKTFNATTSAIRAGYSPSYAHNKAYRLLNQDNVKAFINHVRAQRNEELFIDSLRIVEDYLKIAAADMTDFVRFNSAGVVLKDSKIVDGQLINKISEGKNGVTVELVDKKWAYDKLEKYLGVMPEDWRRGIEEKKLEILQQKLDLEKLKVTGEGGDDDSGEEDDSLLLALGVVAKEVWGDMNEKEKS